MKTAGTVEFIQRTTYRRPLLWPDLREKFGMAPNARLFYVDSDGTEMDLTQGTIYVVEVTEEKLDKRPNFGPAHANYEGGGDAGEV